MPKGYPNLNAVSYAKHDNKSALARVLYRPRRWDGCWRQLLDLPNQKALLVNKLLVFCPVFQKRGQEAQKLIPVANQDALHSH